LLLAWAALFGVQIEARAGTQQCNTECQSKMTDCILACDGIRSCEEVCKKKGQSCVSICTSDAGPPPPLEVADASPDVALESPALDARARTTRDASARRGSDR
jgi:hypothetical protein